MKKSRKIALTLLASTCLLASACSSDQETLQNLYASRNDCENDWGSDDCEPDSDGRHYRGPHYYYRSGRPWYYPRGHSTPIETRPFQGAHHFSPGSHSSKAVSTMASTGTSRGGFGSSSSSHGGGS